MNAKVLKQIILIVFLAASINIKTQANNEIIKGKVVDSYNNPIEYATAALINSKTSEIEQGTISNAEVQNS